MSLIGRRSCEIIMKENTPSCHTKLFAFRSLISWQITSFSKTTLLHRELFLTMFQTINSSALLVTKYGFMLTIILSISPIVSTAFKGKVYLWFLEPVGCLNPIYILSMYTINISSATLIWKPDGHVLGAIPSGPAYKWRL